MDALAPDHAAGMQGLLLRAIEGAAQSKQCNRNSIEVLSRETAKQELLTRARAGAPLPLDHILLPLTFKSEIRPHISHLYVEIALSRDGTGDMDIATQLEHGHWLFPPEPSDDNVKRHNYEEGSALRELKSAFSEVMRISKEMTRIADRSLRTPPPLHGVQIYINGTAV